MSWGWWDWPLAWLTNHRPTVLWHCWMGHVTRKTVFKMTYNVSSGTLNSTIPYHALQHKRPSSDFALIMIEWLKRHRKIMIKLKTMLCKCKPLTTRYTPGKISSLIVRLQSESPVTFTTPFLCVNSVQLVLTYTVGITTCSYHSCDCSNCNTHKCKWSQDAQHISPRAPLPHGKFTVILKVCNVYAKCES